jgi:hypothetical protein
LVRIFEAFLKTSADKEEVIVDNLRKKDIFFETF